MHTLLIAHLKKMGADKLPEGVVDSLEAILTVEMAAVVTKKITPKVVGEHCEKFMLATMNAGETAPKPAQTAPGRTK